MKNPHIGSTLQSFFEELGEWDEVVAMAQKEIIANEIRLAMKASRVSENELARRMNTSRTSVRRVLDPRFTGSTFELLAHASAILGKRLAIVDRAPAKSRAKSTQRKHRRAA